ncbi:MAG: hypothetical protein AB7E96_06860 [Deferribacterales bacterium]
MESECRYPSIGEFWSFIFESTGIWALSEKKGSLQTRLRRLASEESFSLRSQSDIEQELFALLNGLFKDEELSSAVMSLIDEVMMAYTEIITSYMAMYTKEENIKYLLSCHGVGRLALSVCKQLAKLKRNRIPFGGGIDLFVPDFAEDGTVVYPLSKMLSFLNNINLSSKSGAAREHGWTSADSVRRYLNRLDKGHGKRSLEDVFIKLRPLLSFDANPEIENYLKFLVFIAYTSEGICKKIDDKRFLSELVSEFVRQFQNINRDQWDDAADRWASDFPVPYDLTGAGADLDYIDSLFRSKTNIDTYREKVDLFKLKYKETIERYPWISAELDSDTAYLENDFDRSKEHIRRAFELAKYSAGSGILRVFDRAFELSARCGDRELFRQVYKWGKYTKNIRTFGNIDGCYKICLSGGLFVIVTDDDAFEKISEYYRN